MLSKSTTRQTLTSKSLCHKGICLFRPVPSKQKSGSFWVVIFNQKTLECPNIKAFYTLTYQPLTSIPRTQRGSRGQNECLSSCQFSETYAPDFSIWGMGEHINGFLQFYEKSGYTIIFRTYSHNINDLYLFLRQGALRLLSHIKNRTLCIFIQYSVSILSLNTI